MILLAALSNVTGKQVLKYMFMPEILPRLNELFQRGFSSIATFMAFVYLGVRLLPKNHPYLQPHAFGSYGIRDVVREAAGNLDYSYKHIDQVIIFFALIAGLILLGLQFLLLLLAFFVNPASAQVPANYQEFFVTAAPEEDIAFRILDAVFGVEGLFNSSEIAGGASPFNTALHGLFTIYSTGLLVVAGIILIYFIFVVVAETAQTGTPFGKRFNHAWAPIRLVVGIALLIPIGSGFNSAQWITLYAAKFGSGFATNSWEIFNDTLDGSMIEDDQAIATPNVPDLEEFISLISIAHACKQGYELKRPESVGAPAKLHGYILSDSGLTYPLTNSYTYALAAAGKSGVIKIAFGVQDTNEFKDYQNSILPYCGIVSLTVPEPLSEDERAAVAGCPDGDDCDADLSPAEKVSEAYFLLVKYLFYGSAYSEAPFDAAEFERKSDQVMKNHLTEENSTDVPDSEYRGKIERQSREFVEAAIEEAISDLQAQIAEDTDEYDKYGWAGAGIWYNKLANLNGALANAVINKPVVSKYPVVMEYTCEENQQQNANVDPLQCYVPDLAGDRPVQYLHPSDGSIAVGLNELFQMWNGRSIEATGNAFIDTVNLVFGTKGIFDMCQNAHIHPLAQLSAAGKGLIDTAVRNFVVAGAGGIAGRLNLFNAGPALNAASGLAASIAGIGLLIGFILYYMVPFMPFLYFFFAVGTWVRGIFEAMVGVPLWALAHLRIDGEGLPGEAASNGYFLIFEVFVRPILILFGLLASILVFAAMVKVLNEVFHLVTANFTGGPVSNICGSGAADAAAPPPVSMTDYFRGPIDQFFFSVLYAIIVYLTGNSCFKLIDMIPNQILRWMGTGAKSFGDDAGQVAENVIRNVAVGGGMLSGQVGGLATNAMEAGVEGGRGIMSTFFGGGTPAGRGPSGPRVSGE